MKKHTYIVAAVLFSFFLFEMKAQAPLVVSTYPEGQKIDTPTDDEIVVNFDTPIDPQTVHELSFRVFGRWSGPAPGIFWFSNDNTEVRFYPDEPFFAGEWVMVQLSKEIQSATGDNLENPFAWGFWVKTAPGTLQQPLIETIELRLPGETYLQTYGAYAGDMNNDGFSDLVAVNESSDDLRILLNDGQGHYPAFTVYDTGDDSTPSPSEGADFNNDGEIDLVVTTAWDTEVRVLTGDGQGSFSNMDTYYTSNGVRGVVVGDFDGDGWDDMLTTNRLDGDISIFMNNGDGTFSETGMDLPNQDETACVLADVNGDGILDVFFASFNSQKVGVLLGDGAGNFTLNDEVAVQGRPWMIGAGDLNGDGFADVVSVNSNANRTAVLFGDGEGGLGQPVYYAPSNHNFPLAIDIGDLDGDGDLDMVSSNYSSKTYTVFENNGSGQFSVAVTLNSPKAASCAILHDRDNDGDLDITGTDEEDDVILLFENADTTINSASFTHKKDFSLEVLPNPAFQYISVKYHLPSQAEVSMTIFNSTGTAVTQSGKKIQPAGTHSTNLAVNEALLPGLYFFQIEIDGKVINVKPLLIQQ